MTSQPLLPVHTDPKVMEYYPEGDDGVPWAVKDWPGLKAGFEIEAHELVLWHTLLADPSSPPWNVVKRIHGVVAMIGEGVEDDDDIDWTWPLLAKRNGVAEKVLRERYQDAVDYWKKERLSRSIAAVRPAADPVKGLDSGTRTNPREVIADERVAELLEDYRFDHLKGKDRMFVARRVLELRTLLEDKNRREAARQLINMELNLSDFEESRALLKSRLDSINVSKLEVTKENAKEVVTIQEALSKNEKDHTALTTKYLKAADELGSEEIEQGELRKAALGTVSYFIDSHRRFYENGDRAQIDGVFTADELVWLTTPVAMRDSQYRFDIVLGINEALKPYNLFNPDFRPARIPRDASRRMLRLAKQLAEEVEPVHIPDIDDTPADEEEVETDGIEDVTPAAGSTPSPEHSPAAEPAQAVEDFMAM